MLLWLRRLLPLAVAVGCALAPNATHARATARGPLKGTWSGEVAGRPGSGVKRQHIVIVVNSTQTGGSWKLSATCYGPLALDSISNGYHHFLRKVAHAAMCTGGDIDCLRRVGASVYDAVTSHRGGEYD
jgi:hypothetical protein